LRIRGQSQLSPIALLCVVCSDACISTLRVLLCEDFIQRDSSAMQIVRLCLHDQVAVYCVYVPTMAFFAKVSDPAIGGTYMTLLNTVCNMGT